MDPSLSDAFIVHGRLGLPDDLVGIVADGTNAFRLVGLTEGISSVSGGGDLNGDGIGDLVIGSEKATPSDQNSYETHGATYVVFGSTTGFPDTLDVRDLDGSNGFAIVGVPDLLNGEEFGSSTGEDVDLVNDFNGDGIDDLLIVGRGDSYGTNSSVHLIYGRADFPSKFSLADIDGNNGVRFRHSAGLFFNAVGAGDFNGDGRTDIAIGWLGGQGLATTRVTVLFGSEQELPVELDLAGEQDFPSMSFVGHPVFQSIVFPMGLEVGTQVAGIGDVNGDEIDDLMIGLPTAVTDGRFEVGEAYVVFGARGELPRIVELDAIGEAQGFRLTAGLNARGFGRSVLGVGDVDGDGLHDMLVGDHRKWLLYGSDAGFPAELDLRVQEHFAGIAFSDAALASSAGDFNNDGRNDILIGDAGDLLLGRERPDADSTTGQGAPGQIVLPPHTTTTYQFTGTPRAGLAAHIEVIASVSSSSEDPHDANNQDEVTLRFDGDVDMVVMSSELASVSPGETVSLEYSISNRGYAAGTATRVQGSFSNALQDLHWQRTVSAPVPPVDLVSRDDAQFVEISADVKETRSLGDFNGDGVADVAAVNATDEIIVALGTGEINPQIVVLAASGGLKDPTPAGDLNGDGFVDIVVNAKRGTKSYVVFGGSDPNRRYQLDEPMVERMGFMSQQRLSAVGDVNADGFDDLLVHADDPVVISGQAEYPATLDLAEVSLLRSFSGIDPGGWGVRIVEAAPAGDLNGDGYGDMIFSLASFDFSGRGLVLYGGPDLQKAVDVSDLSEGDGFWTNYGRGDRFPVVGLGDINSDGFDDAAFGYDGNEPADISFRGVSVLLGGDTPGESSVVKIADSYPVFPFSVRGTGDINADGVDDFFVETDVHVFGSRDIDALETTLTSVDLPIGYRGQAIRNIGDFNGDKVDDFLVGNRVMLGQVDAVLTNGTGRIDEVIDVAPTTQVVYAVQANVAEDASAASLVNALTATVSEFRWDSAPDNNSAVVETKLAPLLPADLDGDGEVGFSDFLILSANFGRQVAARSEGDVNEDGVVDFTDFELLRDTFGQRRDS